ncbi:acid phosphatase/Vanadium-dependent haloperoxidase [Trichocladium antarcticum]|uniref:Acid phosphatase/Vanadium-dependent haloperoxidase n=1 Tax=Trichocladium antarcticum TaxID=1450529 RepID=A0AAN6UHW8_9PEZI|nr:acid phosphatase/Vanadium-dependent haloperoxidase [Trichocladium antarcticum]
MPDDSIQPLIQDRSSISPTPTFPTRDTMDNVDLGGGSLGRKGKVPWVLALSYVFDWFILAVFGAVGYVLGHIEPNKRPFSLDDRNIAFPFTVHETVPVWVASVVAVIVPIVIIAVISLVLVPGATVPVGTPKSLIWKRKLWELHTGLLGLGLSIIAAWFITNGMKNLFGKPRPDLLSRCQPDLANMSKYIVGGLSLDQVSLSGKLVSHHICKNPDKYILDDGFRSYPSGHSSSSAAGLIYLSLFIASKFAITIPFVAPSGAGSADAAAFTAFPSRTRLPSIKVHGPESYELPTRNQGPAPTASSMDSAFGNKGIAKHNQTVAAVRRQAAAPPIYLLVLSILPFFASVFIAGSRWWDFRHHGFDIMFGYLIGTITAFYAFRFYHLPISRGAGWAWGPRSRDKAFWAGVGSFSYATDHMRGQYRAGDEEEALHAPDAFGRGSALSGAEPGPGPRKGPGPDEADENIAYLGATAH